MSGKVEDVDVGGVGVGWVVYDGLMGIADVREGFLPSA